MKLVTLTSELSKRLDDKQAIKLIKLAGFDGYDFSMFGHNYDVLFNNKNYIEYAKELRNLSDEICLPCLQAHAPSPIMRTLDQVIPMVPIFLRSIEIANILGCKIMVVHPGGFLSAQENKEHLYDKILPYAQEMGVTIATENMFKFKDEKKIETVPAACGTIKDFNEHIDIINNPNFVACLDIGHSQMINCEGAVKMIKGVHKLKALHVQDNDLIHDNHTFPFVGRINWQEVTSALKEINYDGHFTFEANEFMKNFPNELLPSCLNLLHDIGRYLINMIENNDA